MTRRPLTIWRAWYEYSFQLILGEWEVLRKYEDGIRETLGDRKQ